MSVLPPRLTDIERIEGMRHVGYELDQMVRAASLLLPEQVDTASPAEAAKHNAALESALTHERTLIEFMVGKRAQPDDIRPEDFYSASPSWQGPQGPNRTSLLALQKLLHKHLSHLTWTRVKPPQQPGPDLGTNQVRQQIMQIVGYLDAFANDLGASLEQGRARRRLPPRRRATPSRSNGGERDTKVVHKTHREVTSQETC